MRETLDTAPYFISLFSSRVAHNHRQQSTNRCIDTAVTLSAVQNSAPGGCRYRRPRVAAEPGVRAETHKAVPTPLRIWHKATLQRLLRRGISLLTFSFALGAVPIVAVAGVTLDAVGTPRSGTGRSASVPITIGSKANRALVADVRLSKDTTGIAVTCGGQSLPIINGTNGGAATGTVLLAKATTLTGAQTCSFSWTNSQQYAVNVRSFTGVKQDANQQNNFNHGMTVSGQSVTIASTSGDLTTTVALTGYAVATSNRSRDWTVSSPPSAVDHGSGTGTTTHTWTAGGTTRISGLNILQATSTTAVYDVSVNGLALSPAAVTAGGTTTATVLFGNNSNVSSDTAVLDFRFSSSATVDASMSVSLKRVSVGIIPAKTSLTYVATLTVPASAIAGTYRLFAVLSTPTADALPSNNVQSAGIQVGASTSVTASISAEPVLSISPMKYKPFFDATLAANLSAISAQAAKAPGWSAYGGWDSYQFQYVFMSLLSMFEATQAVGAPELSYLEQALTWMEVRISKATIIDNQGYRNWNAENGGLNLQIPYQAGCLQNPCLLSHELNDLQGATEMARAVRIIKADPSLNATYGIRANAIRDFVHKHVFQKILVARGHESGWQNYYILKLTVSSNDKPLQAMNIAAEMHRAGMGEFRPGKTYASLVSSWLNSLLENKVSSPNYQASGVPQSISAAGAELLDFHLIEYPSQCPDATPGCSWDTMHYNRWPHLLVRAYDAGLSNVSVIRIRKTARLLTKIIWDGSFTSPRFRNYTDGVNGVYRNRNPYENSLIYSGWPDIGRFDPEALSALEAMMDCVISSSCTSPSKGYNSDLPARLDLAAGVTLARTRYELGQ